MIVAAAVVAGRFVSGWVRIVPALRLVGLARSSGAQHGQMPPDNDNGSDWFISGAPDPRWSNDQLHTLGRVKGSSFEVVKYP